MSSPCILREPIKKSIAILCNFWFKYFLFGHSFCQCFDSKLAIWLRIPHPLLPSRLACLTAHVTDTHRIDIGIWSQYNTNDNWVYVLVIGFCCLFFLFRSFVRFVGGEMSFTLESHHRRIIEMRSRYLFDSSYSLYPHSMPSTQLVGCFRCRFHIYSCSQHFNSSINRSWFSGKSHLFVRIACCFVAIWCFIHLVHILTCQKKRRGPQLNFGTIFTGFPSKYRNAEKSCTSAT